MPALDTLKKEWTLAAVYVTAALFFAYGTGWLADLSGGAWFALMFGWLFCVIVASAAAIVRHAESLAHLMGEPFGTLVLTIAVIAIEVLMISAVMLTGKGSPVLARDTMFAVVMIVLNGMVGLCLLIGGLRHHEQTYNLQGAISYLAVIIPIAVISLVLPNFTQSTAGPTLSAGQEVFISIASVVLYGVFLGIQTVRHRDYFVQGATIDTFVAPAQRVATTSAPAEPAPRGDAPVLMVPENAGAHPATYTKGGHTALLIAYLVPLVLLSKQIAIPIDYSVHVIGAPVALSGFLVASLVLMAEVVAAIRAAAANQLQRSINIALGSVLASIAMTIPAVLAIGAWTGHTIVLGLEPASMVLLTLTLAVSVLTFASPRTNVLLGVVHLLLFVTYVLLIFDR